MKCCLCGKEMNSIHDNHNPAPLVLILMRSKHRRRTLLIAAAGNVMPLVDPARMVSAGKERMIMPLIDMLEIQVLVTLVTKEVVNQ